MAQLLSMVALLQQLAGHSVGTATTAVMVGVEESTIQTLGHWHSYIRLPKETSAGISSVLARGTEST